MYFKIFLGIVACTSEFEIFLYLGLLPVITSHFLQQAVLPGTDVSLKCVATGNPSPTVTWTLEENPVPKSLTDSYLTGHGDVVSYLNISSIKMEDGGEYQCKAENRVGSTSHSAKLNVIG